MTNLILIRGGGDLASGIAYRLHKAGLCVSIAELPQPLSVRRKVSFSEAVYDGTITVEGLTGRLVSPNDISPTLANGEIPVLVDPDVKILQNPTPHARISVLVDARLTKRPPDIGLDSAKLVIGLGPGFTAAKNCHAVIETQRGHTLGRVYWHGSALADTGIPERVLNYRAERVPRAPADGRLIAHGEIGDHFDKGDIICEVDGIPLAAPFNGSLRGLIRPGLHVKAGLKIGDLDPRDDPRYCTMISDKALALGGSVLEAILSRKEIRKTLWN
ncbi:MAG: EF2563 family selenium-dependent molybdenum hydroxylase system protein [Anaerolineales bacterium]|nr:EF2563 family selenium-dependent molybdenum hydroxylase system protein [Anaerolineales bacterium]